MKQAQESFKRIPSMAAAVKDNAITSEKIELGKLLFFDPRLSASEIISCNSCHNLGTGGVDAGPTSVGHGLQKGPRRAPTVYNAVFNIAQFWDGRAADLKAQAKGPVQASVEMNATPDHVVKTLSSMPAYVEMFKKAFPSAFAGDFRQFCQGGGGFRGDPDHPRCAVRSVPRGRRHGADRRREGRPQAVHEQGLLELPQRHQCRRGSLFPVRCGREAWRPLSPRRQGPLCGDEDGQRRVRLPRRATAQRCPPGSLFPFRSGVEPQAGGGRHGGESNSGSS